jgi:hypothetical protein
LKKEVKEKRLGKTAQNHNENESHALLLSPFSLFGLFSSIAAEQVSSSQPCVFFFILRGQLTIVARIVCTITIIAFVSVFFSAFLSSFLFRV